MRGRRAPKPQGNGLTYIDHLTHNVHRGRMDCGRTSTSELFNFREIRYFDIEGKLTGLKSQGDDQPLRQDPHPDQREQRRQVADRGIPATPISGEGIQHIALGTDDIFATRRGHAGGAAWSSMDTLDTYYELIDDAHARTTARRSRGCAATAS